MIQKTLSSLCFLASMWAVVTPAYAGETVGGLVQKGFKVSGSISIQSQNILILSNDKQAYSCVVSANWQALLQGAPIQTQACAIMP